MSSAFRRRADTPKRFSVQVQLNGCEKNKNKINKGVYMRTPLGPESAVKLPGGEAG